MQYTCIKKDDKYVVMEYVGDEPRLPKGELSKIDLFNYEGTHELWRMSYNRALHCSIPTLPEHSAYWATMEGEVFGEDVFQITNPIYEIQPKVLVEEWDSYAIPKQQEQDLWNEIGLYINSDLNPNQMDCLSKSTIDYLKQHYTLTKQPN